MISCVITSDATCVTGSPATSNVVNVIVNPSVPASVSIFASPSGAVCEGTAVTFSATPSNGGVSPAYQWKKNGSDIINATNSTFVSNTLDDGDEITCVLTSSHPCAVSSPSTSNSITMQVSPVSVAGVSISANPDPETACPGATILFTATPVNGGLSPSYQWKKGNVPVNGEIFATYSASFSEGDVITCEMTSGLPCVSGSPASSDPFTVHYSDITNPMIFSYTGSEQTFTVPACANELTIEVWGAQGGNSSGASPGIGGLGGYATGTLAVASGQVLRVYVGGQSGWNGGASFGGNGQCGQGNTGGWGGDASDVRVGGNSYSDRIIVAGGGGGGGALGDCSFAAGGAGGEGGGTSGGSGVQNYQWGNPVGGTGGTQSSPGSGGPSCDGGSNGSPGSIGSGGSGNGRYSSGGGGGGGYYGGGGGGTCSSGSGGGGGSSWTGGVSNGSTTAGQRTGVGQVIISW
ncbi:MAG: hypothetical protein IT223_07285 [Crocinitomicaceae bacterium]|nr:hypothetical protein [Crocinitomicaceae bacterium]